MQLGEEGAPLTYTSMSQPTIEGSGMAFEAETTEESCLLSFCSWLAQQLLFHVAQHHLPTDSTSLIVLGPPTLINS